MSTDVTPTDLLSAYVIEEILGLMGRRRINKAEMARRLGQSEVWVGRRLNGRLPLGVDDLQRIAAVLGVSPSDLLPREGGTRTGGYLPGERVIATVQGSDRRATQPRRPVKRRHRTAVGSVRPLTPLPV